MTIENTPENIKKLRKKLALPRQSAVRFLA